jgi:hypothetical protein
MHVKVTLKNTGKSVATDGWARILAEPNRTVLLDKEWRKPCDMIAEFQSALALSRKRGSGGTWPIGFVLAPGETAIEDEYTGGPVTFQDIRNSFYLLGCVIYQDQYGKPHHTNFCYQPIAVTPDGTSKEFKACNAFQEAN